MPLLDVLLSAGAGAATGYREKQERERQEAMRQEEIARQDAARQQSRLLSLLGRPGFELGPSGPDAPPTPPGGVLDVAGGAVEPPDGGPARLPNPLAPEAPPTPSPAPAGDLIGTLMLPHGEMGVRYDPSQTPQAKEQARQQRAFDQLPREEFPTFVEGVDYEAELEEWEREQEEEEELRERREVVAKVLGLPVDHPDVEANARFGFDPEVLRARRTKPAEKPDEDRELADAIEEATGIANEAVIMGTQRGMNLDEATAAAMTHIKLAGLDKIIPPGRILGILARAARDYQTEPQVGGV